MPRTHHHTPRCASHEISHVFFFIFTQAGWWPVYLIFSFSFGEIYEWVIECSIPFHANGSRCFAELCHTLHWKSIVLIIAISSSITVVSCLLLFVASVVSQPSFFFLAVQRAAAFLVNNCFAHTRPIQVACALRPGTTLVSYLTCFVGPRFNRAGVPGEARGARKD